MSTERAQVAAAAAHRLESAREVPPAVVGFDGFIDSILHAVDSRRDMSPAGYDRIKRIEHLARRIGAAAGRSMNLEIVQREERWGGNGPLLAGALGRLGAPVTYVGAVGREDDHRVLHPLYGEFAARCRRVIPIAAPGRTLALEFDDGKVMLNEPRNVQAVTWQRVLEAVGGESELARMLEPAALVGIVNWSLLGGVESILEGLIEEVLPQLASQTRPIPDRPLRRVFIDLTDPAKRTDADLQRVLALLRRMNTRAPVTLGLNLAEAERLARVAGAAIPAADPVQPADEDQAAAVVILREALDLNCIVIHRRTGAAAARESNGSVERAWIESPLVRRPRITTGAGDHFNGGFALAQMIQMPLAESLAMACAVAGLYVRSAAAPDRTGVLEFLRNLPRPEGMGE